MSITRETVGADVVVVVAADVVAVVAADVVADRLEGMLPTPCLVAGVELEQAARIDPAATAAARAAAPRMEQ